MKVVLFSKKKLIFVLKQLLALCISGPQCILYFFETNSSWIVPIELALMSVNLVIYSNGIILQFVFTWSAV